MPPDVPPLLLRQVLMAEYARIKPGGYLSKRPVQLLTHLFADGRLARRKGGCELLPAGKGDELARKGRRRGGRDA